MTKITKELHQYRVFQVTNVSNVNIVTLRMQNVVPHLSDVKFPS